MGLWGTVPPWEVIERRKPPELHETEAIGDFGQVEDFWKRRTESTQSRTSPPTVGRLVAYIHLAAGARRFLVCWVLSRAITKTLWLFSTALRWRRNG